MADGSHIEWTDATWNPVTGCSVVSPGCTNCYAMKLAGTRLAHHPSRAGLTRDSNAGPVWTGEVRLNEEWLKQPLKWSKPRRIFVCAHGDLFHESVPDEWIDRVFAVMALAPQHTFQVLTKRSARMRDYLCTRAGDWRTVWPDANPTGSLPISRHDQRLAMGERGAHVRPVVYPLHNVWLGVSVEDQRRADERIPDLLATPAAVRWISAEPLLGPINLERIGTLETVRKALPSIVTQEMRGRPSSGNGSISGVQIEATGSRNSSITFFQTPDHMGGFTANSPRAYPRLDWVVAGGESGPGARPMHPDWARNLRDQCKEAGVPFLFKQWGDWVSELQSPPDAVLPGISRRAWAEQDEDGQFSNGDQTSVYRLGKKAAGRLLDGVLHDGYPKGKAE